jgi:transposase
MRAGIPPKKSRRERLGCGGRVYRLRHLVENAFMHMKQWSRAATRYAKRAASFLAAVHVRCIAMWAKIY